MFNDERINAESGSIYQKGILYATLVSLVYGVLHGVWLYFEEELAIKHLFTELFIVICGVVILLVGAVRFLGKADERLIYEKHTYYLNAGKIFLVAALSGYALTIPFAMESYSNDRPINELILILEVLGYIYFFYSFKSKDISFNYTFIDEDKRKYYACVFINIGKLAVFLAIPFFVAIIIDIGLNQSAVSFFSILYGYISSVLGLGLEYLFISWVEKLSYDEEDSERLKKGTAVVAIALIVVCLGFLATNVWYYRLLAVDLQNSMETIAFILSLKRSFENIVNVLTAMFLCHLMAQTRQSKLVKTAVAGTLIVTVVSVIEAFVVSMGMLSVTVHLEKLLTAYAINEINNYAVSFTYLASLVSIIFVFLLVGGLVRDVGVSKALWLVPILNIVGFGVEMFFVSQSMLTNMAVTQGVVKIASSVIGLIILAKHKNYERSLQKT